MSVHLPYRGRFAPSPTGLLHFGSLIAAVGSYLQAKFHDGEWFVRIDDIDPPREQAGASENILFTLEQFGFEWDGPVIYQSQNLKRYQAAVDELVKQQLAYPCSCSRSQIIKKSNQTKGQIVYPGYCRTKPLEETGEYSLRLNCENKNISFHDALQGQQNVNLEDTAGDFILQRRDRNYSYHLATGIDDAEQGVTEVVRGSDLLECTPSQLIVQQVLNLPSPVYCHLPIAMNAEGQKLSKQTHATPINAKDSVVLLYKTLKFLGQMPPNNLIKGSQEDIWHWAITHWQLDLVPTKNTYTEL